MLIRFWGTRGSIPTPGAKTIRYGGNTSCVELRSSQGNLIVIDCGTGAYALGQKLMAKSTDHLRGHLLISHTHWDHIQGVPFFAPFFVAGNKWDIYGPKGLGQSIRDTLAGQMQHTYFPVALDQLGATLNYHDLVEGTFQIEDIKVTTYYLNHTMLTCGYRFEVDDLVVVYCCDHEPHSRKLATGKGNVTGRDQQYAKFLANADLVIHDAQYTAEEYPQKIGWGHSTVEYAVKICQYAKVKRLVLTHHDPSRSDDAIDRVLEGLNEHLTEKGSPLEIIAAAEGQEIIVLSEKKKIKTAHTKNSATVSSDSALVNPSVLLCSTDSKLTSLLTEAIESDNVHFKLASNPKNLQKQILEEPSSLILLQHNPPVVDGLAIAETIRKENSLQEDLPIILISKQEDLTAGKKAGVTDWLIEPFSVSYARSKVHAWLMRTVCRWVVAPLPSNEKERLATLQQLKILDTKPEERFDRITRIASALFDVPIVAVSLIDKDRQWLKSCVGTTVQEMPREISFCSHVVYKNEMVIVPDTFQDDRFADNPLVTHEPRMRFYAGSPLLIDGAVVGTLCLIDTRPRFFLERDIKLLEDLRDLTVKEFST